MKVKLIRDIPKSINGSIFLISIYQFRIIVKMKRELNDIWMSITNIIIGVAPLVTEKQLKKENEDKKS